MKRLILTLLLIIPSISFASSSTTPGNIFIDYYRTSTSSISIGFLMPFGNNGKYLFLENKGKGFASSTFERATPQAQSVRFNYKFDKPGSYEIKAYLCNDKSKSDCSISTPLHFVASDKNVLDEYQIDESDMTISRKILLDKNKEERYLNYIISNFNKNKNLKSEPPKNYTNSDNVIRIKKLLSNTSLISILESSKNFDVNDFYRLVSKYPAFCNESINTQSKDITCGKELASYFALLLHYTNNNIDNVYQGMKNRENLANLIGREVSSNINSRDMFELLLDYYMRDRNPEPSMHSVISGTYLLNDNDYKNNISHNFGTVINIASHGMYCTTNEKKNAVRISNLYKSMLSLVKAEDGNPINCDNQKPFSIYSNSFYPQYLKINPVNNKCELSLIESDYLKNCKESDLRNVEKEAVINTNKFLKENALVSTSENVDSRVNTEKTIAATYTYDDSRFNSKDVPFNKINTVIYEDAFIDSNNLLRFNDEYISLDKYFVGDCLRSDCKRGVINNLKTGKEINKNLKIILDVKINNIKQFKDIKNINIATKQISEYLTKNDYIDGISFSIDKVNNKDESEYFRKLIVTLKNIFTLEDKKKTISITILVDKTLIANIDFESITPLISDVYLLSYDIHSPKEKLTNHVSPIYSVRGEGDYVLYDALTDLSNKKVEKKRIVIGLPAYGRKWDGVVVSKNNSSSTPGLFAPHSTKYEDSYISYFDIADKYLLKGDFKYYEDKARQASYLYDGKTFISYMSPEIVYKDSKKILDDEYKGIMLLNVSSDNGELIEKILSSVKNDTSNSCKLEKEIKNQLFPGIKGGEVYVLQNYLKCMKYLPSYFDVNGSYDQETSKAVKTWQLDNSLRNIGIIDKKSLVILNKNIE